MTTMSTPRNSGYGQPVILRLPGPPPPLPGVSQPPIPGDGYIWTPGYWSYAAQGYYWVPGAWTQPTEAGYLWTPGYWGFVDGRYRYHYGFWGRPVGYYGGVDYGFGYVGTGYRAAERKSFQTITESVNNVSTTNVQVYNHTVTNTVINNTTVNNTTVNNTPVIASYNRPGSVTRSLCLRKSPLRASSASLR